jgi:DNA replicative helicase MCM subunit Mcm2 (Cdc46/Mcm family)
MDAGAITLAERDLKYAHVFYKMQEGRVSIQESIEPQTGNFSKAVIHASLNAQCWVPAAANHVYRTVDRKRMIQEILACQIRCSHILT